MTINNVKFIERLREMW